MCPCLFYMRHTGWPRSRLTRFSTTRTSSSAFATFSSSFFFRFSSCDPRVHRRYSTYHPWLPPSPWHPGNAALVFKRLGVHALANQPWSTSPCWLAGSIAHCREQTIPVDPARQRCAFAGFQESSKAPLHPRTRLRQNFPLGKRARRARLDENRSKKETDDESLEIGSAKLHTGPDGGKLFRPRSSYSPRILTHTGKIQYREISEHLGRMWRSRVRHIQVVYNLPRATMFSPQIHHHSKVLVHLNKLPYDSPLNSLFKQSFLSKTIQFSFSLP